MGPSTPQTELLTPHEIANLKVKYPQPERNLNIGQIHLESSTNFADAIKASQVHKDKVSAKDKKFMKPPRV